MMATKDKTGAETEKGTASADRTSKRASAPAPVKNSPVLADMRQAAGNFAVQRLFQAGTIQAKLAVSRPGDMDEQEADRVAAAVVSSVSSPVVQRKCSACASGATCPKCEEEQGSVVKRKTDNAAKGPASIASYNSLGLGAGQPLEASTRALMERSLDHDFRDVRVHTDSRAAESAASINAHAYTIGQHMAFGAGQYMPDTNEGKRLLAHELVHVIQQRDHSITDGIIQRDPDPPTDLPIQGNAPPTMNNSRSGGNGVQVQIISLDDYAMMTGQSPEQLPEGEYVPATDIEVAERDPLNWEPAAGMAIARPPMPGLPIPNNATGVLWEGAHLSDFAVVDGKVVARGFRAGLGRHMASSLERSFFGNFLFGRGGGPATTSLNRGVPGSFANDWLFPYMPGATAVYRTNPVPGEAANFVELMNSRVPVYEGQPYSFSTPPPEHPAYARAFGDNLCPPGVSNCITLPGDVHRRGLGGNNLVLENQGNPIDIITGEPGSRPGLARNMDAYVEQPEPFFRERGLTRTPIAGGMWARAGVGFIKAGGVVLLVYGTYKTTERIVEATPEERPLVIAEEAGGWGGGFIGTVLGSAFGGAFVCAESGPGAFLCAAAFGLVGGLTGTVVGQETAHEVYTTFEHAQQMTALDWVEASARVLGDEEGLQAICDLKEWEGIDDPLCNPW